MTICLIGEADWFLARLLKRFGEASGFQVARAKAGQDLLGLARELKPALIIVETELPGTLRGWEAIQALRTDPELCHIPVITCSWLGADEAEARVGGAAGHLQKPDLHYEEFLAVLAGAAVDLPQRDTND
jgi:adenylate cyclase